METFLVHALPGLTDLGSIFLDTVRCGGGGSYERSKENYIFYCSREDFEKFKARIKPMLLKEE